VDLAATERAPHTVQMQTIRRSDAMSYVFAAVPPLITVDQGESFAVETEDAGSGQVRSVAAEAQLATLPTRHATPPKSNPVGGPIFVRDAEPGDLLEVEIQDIEVDGQGFTNWGPGRTPIGDHFRWPQLNRWTLTRFEHRPGPSGSTRDGDTYLDGRKLWPLRPMIGCIAVAPEREVLNTSTGQAVCGGNLDVRDIAVGSKVYLNVYHPGALLHLGDVHGSQADTEYYGTADETRATVTARCRVLKEQRIPFIRIRTDSALIAVRTGKSLDLLVHEVVADMVSWLVAEFDVSAERAYLHTCVNPDFRINIYQYTLGLATVGAELPVAYVQ
jgi:amidase